MDKSTRLIINAVDHPKIRNQEVCPLCKLHKPLNLVVCWGCWHNYEMRLGNSEAEKVLDLFEASLNGFEVNHQDHLYIVED
jgi:hypothetical protein